MSRSTSVTSNAAIKLECGHKTSDLRINFIQGARALFALEYHFHHNLPLLARLVGRQAQTGEKWTFSPWQPSVAEKYKVMAPCATLPSSRLAENDCPNLDYLLWLD